MVAVLPQMWDGVLELRPVIPSDLVQLLPLCVEHAAYEGSTIHENDQAMRWNSAFFGTPPQLYGWVCSEGGHLGVALKGYMTASISISTWFAKPYVFLDCIYLKPIIRRMGIGRSMLMTLREFARGQGCQEIQWQTILSNETGSAFYSSLGAIPVTKTRWSLPVE